MKCSTHFLMNKSVFDQNINFTDGGAVTHMCARGKTQKKNSERIIISIHMVFTCENRTCFMYVFKLFSLDDVKIT